MPNKVYPRVDQLLIKLLKKNQYPEIYFSEIRNLLSVEKSRELLKEIDRYPHLRKRLIGPLQPFQLTELSVAHSASPISLENELKWARSYLLAHSDILNKYFKHRHLYSNNLINGESEKAIRQLSLIESTIGFSLWAINCRISCLQIFEGLEAQKVYAQQIKESFRPILIPFLAHWISVRNEPTVSMARFEAEFLQSIAGIDEQREPGLIAHLKFHVLPNTSFTIDEIASILRRNFAHSLVDYYEALVATAPTIIQSGSKAEKQQLTTLLKKLAFHLQDDRLNPLLQALLKTEVLVNKQCETQINEVYELLLIGKTQTAYSRLSSLINSYPEEPWTLVLAAYTTSIFERSVGFVEQSSKQTVNTSPIYKKLIEQLATIIERGISASHEYNELLKLSINFTSFSWTAAIDLVLLEETTTCQSSIGGRIALRMSTVALPTVRLLRLNKLPINYDYTQLKGTQIATANQYITGYIQLKIPTNLPITLEHQQLAATEINYASGNYTNAITQGNLLTKSNIVSFQRKAFRLIVRSLIETSQYSQACAVICKAYIQDTSIHAVLPIEEVALKSTDTENYQQVSNQLSLSIVLDIYAKHINRKLESKLRYAFEDFLLAYGLDRPSQLMDISQQFDSKELIYFLRNICVEAVMDVSPVFSSSRELTEERITVCRLLTKLDTKHADEYQSEINELVRRQVISKRMHEIEQSRIYVDIGRLKEWAQLELQETYTRYIAFVEYGLDAESTALHLEAKQRMAESDIMGLLAISVPDNEPNILFRRLVESIRDAYTTNAEFGLLRYLSTRVRHGALENELRKPLKAHRLITQKEKATGKYLSNYHWLDRLSLDETQAKQLDQSFGNFSTAYDALISNILTEWLQIRRNGQTAGLLDFTITDGELSLLASKVNQKTTFKQFVELIVSHMDERLLGGLQNIQIHLASQAKSEARELLNTLQNQVAAIAWDIDSGELEGAISLARTETQAVFDRVDTWFNPSPLSATTPYTIDDAVSVAEAIVQEASPQLTFSAPLEIEGAQIAVPFQGGLPAMVDVFLNVFDNVVRHSGNQQPVANTHIKVVEEAGNLIMFHIRITNEINSTSDIDDINKRIILIRQKLDAGNYESSITSEGGSGFFKIHRSLRDFYLVTRQEIPQLRFEIVENSFVVNLCIPARWIEYDIEKLHESTY